jgi:ParB family chromosome partitioning protein
MASLVAVRKIAAATPRSAFAPEAIEQAARLVLEAGALARPLILRRKDLESFELISGEFAYHAAARARELDSLKGEMVLAFVAEPENEALLLRQTELLNQVEGASPTAVVPTATVDGTTHAIATNLERFIELQLRELKEHHAKENAAFRQTQLELVARIPKPEPLLQLLNGSSDLQLQRLLKETGPGADKLLQAIRAARPFVCYEEAIERTNGLSDRRMNKLQDACARHPSYVPAKPKLSSRKKSGEPVMP